MNIARVVITGNLTHDPELRHTAGGYAVCTLRVAVNSREKQDGNWGDYTSYFDVTVWGNQGDACATHLSKGRPVAVDGRLREDRWEAKDGSKRSAVKIVADTVQFLGSGRSDDGGAGSGGGDFQTPADGDFSTPTADFAAPDADFQPVDDDIPF